MPHLINDKLIPRCQLDDNTQEALAFIEVLSCRMFGFFPPTETSNLVMSGNMPE